MLYLAFDLDPAPLRLSVPPAYSSAVAMVCPMPTDGKSSFGTGGVFNYRQFMALAAGSNDDDTKGTDCDISIAPTPAKAVAGLVAACVSAPDYLHPDGEDCAGMAWYCEYHGTDHGTQADGRSANEACCECGGGDSGSGSSRDACVAARDEAETAIRRFLGGATEMSAEVDAHIKAIADACSSSDPAGGAANKAPGGAYAQRCVHLTWLTWRPC